MAAQEIPLAGFRTRLLSRSSVAVGTMAFTSPDPQGSPSKLDRRRILHYSIP